MVSAKKHHLAQDMRRSWLGIRVKLPHQGITIQVAQPFDALSFLFCGVMLQIPMKYFQEMNGIWCNLYDWMVPNSAVFSMGPRWMSRQQGQCWLVTAGTRCMFYQYHQVVCWDHGPPAHPFPPTIFSDLHLLMNGKLNNGWLMVNQGAWAAAAKKACGGKKV